MLACQVFITLPYLVQRMLSCPFFLMSLCPLPGDLFGMLFCSLFFTMFTMFTFFFLYVLKTVLFLVWCSVSMCCVVIVLCLVCVTADIGCR